MRTAFKSLVLVLSLANFAVLPAGLAALVVTATAILLSDDE